MLLQEAPISGSFFWLCCDDLLLVLGFLKCLHKRSRQPWQVAIKKLHLIDGQADSNANSKASMPPKEECLKDFQNSHKTSEHIAAEDSRLYKHVKAQFDSLIVSRAKLWLVAKDPVAELKFGSRRWTTYSSCITHSYWAAHIWIIIYKQVPRV